MISSEIKHTVLYADTDAMGIVYYANYLRFYEEGRRDFFNKLGFLSKEIEEKSVIFPAARVNIKYKKPAEMDDTVIIRTCVKESPAATIKFEQKVMNESHEVLNEAEIILACVDSESMRPKRCPKEFINAIENSKQI